MDPSEGRSILPPHPGDSSSKCEGYGMTTASIAESEGATVCDAAGGENESALNTCDAPKSRRVEPVNPCGLASCPAESGGVCPLENLPVAYPLHNAVRRLDFSSICSLLSNPEEGNSPSGIEVDALNGEGWTALHVACAGPSTACAQMLLEARACVNVATPNGSQTPLHLAVQIGSFTIVELLLEARADVQAYEADQLADEEAISTFKGVVRDPSRHQTALHIAAAGSNIAIMSRLLDAKASVDIKNSFEQTPLHLALVAEEDGDELSYGCGVRIQGIKSRPERNGKLASLIGLVDQSNGRWPVLVEEGPPEGVLLKPENFVPIFSDAVEFLLNAKADVNLGNRKCGLDHSMLHEAAVTGNLTNAERAIAHGANVNMQRTGSMLAPLHLAARKRKVELIEVLMKARADPRLLEGSGKTAIDLAGKNNLPAQAMALLES